jgi:hypothetical protein
MDEIKQTASNDNVEATPISVEVTDEELLRAAATEAAGPTGVFTSCPVVCR